MQGIEARYLENIKYKVFGPVEGTGEISCAGNTISVNFKFLVGPDGESLLHCQPTSFSNLVGEISIAAPEAFGFTGRLSNGAQIACDKIYIENSHISKDVSSPVDIQWRCVTGDAVYIKPETELEDFPLNGSFGLSNFDFLGTEFSTIGNQRIRDKFSFDLSGRHYTIQKLQEDKERFEAVRSRRIQRILTAEIKTTIDNQAELSEIKKVVNSISWMLSAALGTKILNHYCIVYSGDSVVYAEFYPCVSSEYTRGGILLDDKNKPDILACYIEDHLSKFETSCQEYDIKKYIDYLCFSQRSLPVEMKLVSVIMALEMICGKICEFDSGWTNNQLEVSNIQQKMRHANNVKLRFIPSRYTQDWLRGDIRNPLIHTGVIHTHSPKQLFEIFRELYVLAVQIYFSLIGYTGQYVDIADDFNVKQMPAST